jgi:hydroxymethylbilane synthase
MSKVIRIGTRESKLALWQAEEVNGQLLKAANETSLNFIKSDGDIDLITPLYELGVQGIFTKALDIALLENKIDIAVHSYKDVPTQLAKGLQIAAVLKRGNPFDVLVCRNDLKAGEFLKKDAALIIATSSIRRKAQWLHHYPNSQINNLRGNVNTRLLKLASSNWHGAIFAGAGLERLGIDESKTGQQLLLDWMLPAPAQGAIAIVCRVNDTAIINGCIALNDEHTQICTQVERDFLRALQGGCSTPISAFAEIDENIIYLRGNVTATDGSESITIKLSEPLSNASLLAAKAAQQIIEKGAHKFLVR